MVKNIFINVLMIIIFLCSFSNTLYSENIENLPDLIKKIEKSVVSVYSFGIDGNPVATGTGFFLNNKGVVVTNRHVLYGSGSANIKTFDGKTYQVEKIISEDVEKDLIKVSVNGSHAATSYLRVSPTLPAVGERVVVIGSPLGLEQTVSDGIVSSIREIQKFGKIIQLTAPISSGSSGSPVVNLKGLVVGVATFQATRGQNLNFAVPASNIRNMNVDVGLTIPEWDVRRAKFQTDSSHVEEPGKTGEKNYELSEGFRALKWGTQLADAKGVYPDLLAEKIIYGAVREDRDYHFRRASKSENKIISGLEFDRIRYGFVKRKYFSSIVAELRFEIEYKSKAIWQYKDLRGKIIAKYGNPFYEEKKEKDYYYSSVWHIGNEHVGLGLDPIKGHVIFKNSGEERETSMLELSLHIRSDKVKGKTLDF